MNKIDEIALQLAHRKCTSYNHVPTDMVIKYSFAEHHLIDFANALLAELSKDAEPVGYFRQEYMGGPVIWYQVDYKTEGEPLFTHPYPVIASEQKPVAWVDVIDRHEGPYNFNGLELLDSGKHLLFTSPPNTADIEQRVAKACARVAADMGLSGVEGYNCAENILLKWREYL